MIIRLCNKYGTFEIGGGGHENARLLEISGLGLVQKETSLLSLASSAGNVITNIRDTSRTITLKFDYFAEPKDTEKLLKILNHEADILIMRRGYKRRIKGIITSGAEPENIIYHLWQNITLQFYCENPYFTDERDITLDIFGTDDMLPNVNENNAWYVSLPEVATKIRHDTDVFNTGDTRIFPVVNVWRTQNGAESDITTSDTVETSFLKVENTTTGKSAVINYEISLGEKITFDFDIRKITSTKNGDITTYISDDTVLSEMYLEEGKNNIKVTSSVTESVISAKITYRNNYASAVI